jgi:LmbE family N-acetylglucosaminyl deacetylase
LTGLLVLLALLPLAGTRLHGDGDGDLDDLIAALTVAAEPVRTRRETALVVVAHPDDETLMMGGTLARLAAGGWQVVVLSATRGEAGWVADPHLATRATLGAVREQELRHACAVLGLASPIVWRYPDGGLATLDPAAFSQAVVCAIAQIRPQLVFTWGPDGGYGHPDHRAVHRAVTAAVQQTRTLPGGPQGLYYPIVRPPRLRRLLRRLRAGPRGPQPAHPAPLPVTTRVDVRRTRWQRAAALRVYRSQRPAEPWLGLLAAWRAPRDRFSWRATEAFHRAGPPARSGTPPAASPPGPWS